MRKGIMKAASIFTAAAMMAVMALPAFAAEGDLPTNANNQAETPLLHNYNTATAEASSFVTKNLLMAKGATTPAKTFNYVITPIQLSTTTNVDTGNTTNGTTVPPDKEPVITIKQGTNAVNKIVTTKGEAGVIVDASSHAFSATGTERLVQKTATIMDKDGTELTGADFPYAGEYVYTITETPDANDASIQFSKASYQIHIFVANKTAETTDYNGTKDANGTDGLYIAAISAARMTNTDDYNAATAATPTKVNTTDLHGYNNTGNALDFQNLYVEYSKLSLQKKVAGAYADQTKFFTFNTKIDLPATGVIKNADGTVKTKSYTAYVYNAETNTRVAEADNKDSSGTTHPVAYTFTVGDDGVGVAQNVLLKHNQYLRFENDDTDKTANLPVGTTYTSTETKEADYTATASLIYSTKDDAGNDVNTDKTAALGNAAKAANKDLTVIEYTEAGYAADPKTVDHTLVGEGLGNAAEFLNTYKTVTPTGIVIDNLPYIMLILLAIGGLFAVIAGKRRKRNTQ